MIRARTIAETVAAARPDEPAIIPTEEQIAVIESDLAPTLVVAGAGSGKTATMADRVVWLVVNGIARPDEVLGLTFTRKAAGELAERVRRKLRVAHATGLIAEEPLGLAVSTYNSFAAAVVRDHALRIGASPDSVLISQTGAALLMQEIVDGWPGALDVDASPRTVAERALSLAEGLRSHLVSVADARTQMSELLADLRQTRSGKSTKELEKIPQAMSDRLQLLDIVEAYMREMRERGLLEFSDQVSLACQIAREVPRVGESMRDQYRVVLLDEFQDTSIAQLRFLVDLFGPGFPAMAVGDPNQSIYGWRGASASSLSSFRELFSTAETPTTVRHLTTSWRNDAAILRAANTISSSLGEDRTGTGALLKPLVPRDGAGEGTIHGAVSVLPADEADLIAAWIRDRWKPGERTAAVLCRAGGQFSALLTAFRDIGIEPEVVGLKGLLSTPEVTDLRAALEVAADATRGDSLMRLLTNQRLGLADLDVLNEWAAQLAGEDARGSEDVSSTLTEALATLPPAGFRTRAGHRLTDAGRARLEALATQIHEIRAALRFPLTDLILAAQRVLRLDIEVAARYGMDPALSRGNLAAFVNHAAAYAAGVSVPTLSGFLSWLDAADTNEKGLELAPAEVNPNAVQILTMHAAKGLEWDVVAIAGMSEGKFPHHDGITKIPTEQSGWLTNSGAIPNPLRGDAEYLPELITDAESWTEFKADLTEFRQATFDHAMAEERRLAYVAVTRPKKHLLLSSSWYSGDAKKPRPLSRFLEEVRDTGLLEMIVEAPPPDADAERPEPRDVPSVSYPGTVGTSPRHERLREAARLVERSSAAESDGPDEALARIAAQAGQDPRVRALAEDARLLLREPAEREAAGQLRLTGHLTASAAMALVRSPREFARDTVRPIPRKPSSAAQTGTEFHAWVEEFFGAPALFFDDALDDDAADAGRTPHLAELIRSFEASPWAERTADVVAMEVDVDTTIAGHVVRSRIDAVFRTADGVQVVDWKTGREPQDPAEVEIRQLQLEIYRLAYSRTFGLPLDRVSAAFHYVASGVTRDSGMWTEAQIEDRFLSALGTLGTLEP